MKKLITVLFLILLMSTLVLATKGNPDILKRDIITDCIGIDEFGNCITEKEIDPVDQEVTKTLGKIGASTAVNLGLDDSIDIITVAGILLIGVVILVLVIKVLSK